MSAPTVADVDRITGLADPVVRNLQITHCYFRAYHERQALFDPRCAAEQLTALTAGHRPEDRL